MTKKTISIPILGIIALVAVFLGLYRREAPEAIVPVPEPKAPTFEQYLVADAYDGPIPLPNFANFPEARKHKDAVVEAISAGVNFAGHYVIVPVPCDPEQDNCEKYVIVDAISGVVIDYGLTSAYGLDFRPTSRLLVANPDKGEGIPEIAGTEPTYYALNQNNERVFIAKTLQNGDLLCTRAFIAQGMKVATSEQKQFDPCTVDDAFVVMDMERDLSVNFVANGEARLREGETVFLYDSSGTPASLTLAFNGASQCFVTTEGVFPCDKELFLVDAPAYIEGFRSNGVVTVWLLELKR